MFRPTFGNGPCVAPAPPRGLVLGLAWGAVFLIVLAAVTLVFVLHAHAGCTTIPLTPEMSRRDAVCQALGQQPTDCFFTPARLVGVQLRCTEQAATVYVANQNIGTFSLVGGPPVDQSTVTKEYLDSLLRFSMGSPAIQARLHQLFPKLPVKSVIYFDETTDMVLSEGFAAIDAQAMVVTP